MTEYGNHGKKNKPWGALALNPSQPCEFLAVYTYVTFLGPTSIISLLKRNTIRELVGGLSEIACVNIASIDRCPHTEKGYL